MSAMSQHSLTIGWDIGGAHLKACLLATDGEILQVIQLPCPVWQGLSALQQAIRQVLAEMNVQAAQHAVTMTAELVDLFSNRLDGVQQICALLKTELSNVSIYAGTSGFIPLSQVHQHAKQIASANWLASAQWLARHYADVLLLDIGSTTTDLIWIANGKVMSQGHDDEHRLMLDELIYTGVVRTPLMALCQRIVWHDQETNIAAEYFATTADIYRICGELPEQDDVAPTADGQDKSIAASMRRLARMVGADVESAPAQDWMNLAKAFKAEQMHLLLRAMARLSQRYAISSDTPVAGAGAGRFLLAQLAQASGRHHVDISQLFNAERRELSQQALLCLPAYAVAWLCLQQDVVK